MGRREGLYGLFFGVEATCRLLYRDLEVAVDELVAVGAEVEARRERLLKACTWAEQLARAAGREEVLEMGLDMEEKESEHVVLGGRQAGKLDAAIARAQVSMSNPRLDGTNPAFKGSRFASLAEVRNAVVPALAREGVSVSQHPTVRDGRLCLRTRLAGYGEALESTLELKVSRDDPQGVGSAITYARRYALAAIACVAGDDDDDGNAASGRGNAASSTAAPPGPLDGPETRRLPQEVPPPKQAKAALEAPGGPSGGVAPEASPEAWERRIATAPDLDALGKVGSELSKAPREVRDWCRDKFQERMIELSKKEGKNK